MEAPMRQKDQVEISLLKRFGLRYSILAAWEGDLLQKGVAVPPSVPKQLARSRMKISSGCFTACDVGCDLLRAEATLFSIAVSAGQETAESWLDMLAECMSERVEIETLEKKIAFPAVRMQYNRFRFDGACGHCAMGEALEA